MANELENMVDESKYVLVNSLDVLFDTCSWHVPEVHVLRDGQNRPLAYVAITNLHNIAKERTGLPVEFFNHQLINLDYKNPDKLAAFMSEYGFLGHTFYGSKGSENFSKALKTLDSSDRDSIMRFEEETGYMSKSHLLVDTLDWHDIHLHYGELKVAFAEVEERLKTYQVDENILSELKIRGIVSVERAQYLYEDWLYCVKHIQAMVQYETPVELAKALNEDELGVIRACEGARNILQEHLNGVHPTLDILNITEDEYVTRESGHPSGSFEQALALQIWNFVLESKSGYTVCKECGKVFVHKQTKARKSQSRSTSVFCCDRCKNRYAQREYRKSPGYRMKTEKRKP